MTRTVVVQIGNTDNKLSQQEWSQFIKETESVLAGFVGQVHFSGGSSPDAPWQNWCFVHVSYYEHEESLKIRLKELALKFRQDSIAVTFGETQFVEAV